MIKVVDIRFKRACKVYEFDCGGLLELLPGDSVIVEVDKGLGMGSVVCAPREAGEDRRPRPLKKVLRKASPADMERLEFNARREEESLSVCAQKIKSYGLPMKLVKAEYLFDSSKAIFYFTSDSRVDFRRLVKDLASAFHTRIEMRQIGVRDEAKMLGGIGPCGRELCCSSFLPDFTPVTIKMAKQQNLALNPSKISGVCGRLMCCLSYEHRGYTGGGERGRRQGKSCCDRKSGNESEAASDKKPQSEGRPDRERRPDREGRPDRERRPGQGRRGGGRRPEGERNAGNEGRPDRERRPGQGRRGGGRRPEGERNAGNAGNERRPSESRGNGERKAQGERNIGNTGNAGNERRPGESRPNGERKAQGERRLGQGRRGGRGRRPPRDRRPDESRGGEKKAVSEKSPDGGGNTENKG